VRCSTAVTRRGVLALFEHYGVSHLIDLDALAASAQPIDFLGVNYYNVNHVEPSSRTEQPLPSYRSSDGHTLLGRPKESAMSVSKGKRPSLVFGLVLALVLTLLPAVASAGRWRWPRPTTTTTTTTPAAPAAPANLRLAGIEDLQIHLAWDPSPGATGYQIEQNGVCCYWATPASFTWGPATPGSTYTYRVRTYSINNQISPFTVPLVVEVPDDNTPPSTPTSLRATDVGITSVSLAWEGGDDENGNVHFRLLANGATLQEVVFGHTFQATTLERDTEYRFQVVAVDYAGNESPPSDILTVRTEDSADVTAPTTPTIVSVSTNWGCEIFVTYVRSTDDTDPPEAIRYEFWLDGLLAGASVGGTGQIREQIYGNAGIEISELFIRALDTAGNFSDTETRVIKTKEC
jgi:chitodextrinase